MFYDRGDTQVECSECGSLVFVDNEHAAEAAHEMLHTEINDLRKVVRELLRHRMVSPAC